MMGGKLRKKSFFCFLVAAFIIFTSGCTIQPSENTVKGWLNNMLERDFVVILEGIDADAVLDEPYFEIVEFNSFDEGMFRHLAQVHFYFLSDINVRIVRRYRYNRRHFRWELFHNVYERFEQTETE